MGASFRNVDEILQLAGCDLLTISPKFLEALSNDQGTVERKLEPKNAQKLDIKEVNVDEKSFRYQLNDNAMAIEKLAEGIRKFAADTIKLETYITQRIAKNSATKRYD